MREEDNKHPKSPEQPGSVKRDVLTAAYNKQNSWLGIPDFCKATGRDSDQVRPAVKDAKQRGELTPKPVGGNRYMYRITDKGAAYLGVELDAEQSSEELMELAQ